MRRTYRIILALCVVTVVISLVGLFFYVSQGTEKAWKPPQIVRFETEINGKASGRFPPVWLTKSLERRPGGCLVSDGEILNIDNTEGDGIFPYLAKDGSSLLIQIKKGRTLMQGKVVTLSDEDETMWDWLGEAENEDLTSLRLVGLPGEIAEASQLALVRKLAETNPTVGLVFESEVTLRQVLPMFDPRWLLLQGDELSLTPEDLNIISQKKHLETLWIASEELESLDFLAPLSNLRSLVIVDWEPEASVSLPRQCRSLESLTLWDSGIIDLSLIQKLERLTELHLVACENLTNIRAVTELSGLHTLDLAFCSELSDLSALRSLPDLKWLSLPPRITQEQLAAVIRDHPDLSVLEMVDCENIENLEPLCDLPKLEYLVITRDAVSYLPLKKLTGLRFLALPEEAFEESAKELRELEKALPDCQVVAGEKFCLGSGWILFLFPLVACMWVISCWAQRRTIFRS